MRALCVALLIIAFASAGAATDSKGPPPLLVEVDPNAASEPTERPLKLKRSPAHLSKQILSGTAACCLVSIIPAGVFAAPTATAIAISRLNPRAGALWPIVSANVGALVGLVIGSVSIIPLVLFATENGGLGTLATLAVFGFPYLTAYGFTIAGALLGDKIATDRLQRDKDARASRRPRSVSMAY